MVMEIGVTLVIIGSLVLFAFTSGSTHTRLAYSSYGMFVLSFTVLIGVVVYHMDHSPPEQLVKPTAIPMEWKGEPNQPFRLLLLTTRSSSDYDIRISGVLAGIR